jgi:solute carrier family 25 folate transporter 32
MAESNENQASSESATGGANTTSWTKATMQTFSPLLAGLAGGACSTVLLYPLDLVKVRLQVNEDSASQKTSVDKKEPRRLSSMQMFRVIVRHEGIVGLYQGLVPAVVGSSVSWGGYFFVYEGMKREYRHVVLSSQKSRPLNSVENFTLACLAGASMVAITNPVWLIKTRMQLQMKRTAKELRMRKEPYNGMLDAGRTIIREEGFWALYKGAGPALLLVSHGGVQFVVYEFLKKHFHVSRAKRDASLKRSSVVERLQLSTGYLTMGAVSKIIASTTTYPLQVIKSRMQQRSESVEVTSTGGLRVVERHYGGLVDTTWKIFQKEGIAGFFKGCIPNALRVAPGAALTFVVYESVMDACGQ